MTMRVTKVLGSLVAVLTALVAITATTESRAGDEELVNATCAGGNLVVTGKSGWHPNAQAPWKWDGGAKLTLDEHQAKFAGCKGTLKAFICSGTSCKGPIEIVLK
jgi:hypothetical protein